MIGLPIVCYKTHWLRMIVIPVLSEERVAKVFGAVLDVSDLYEEFEKATETFTQIPGDKLTIKYNCMETDFSIIPLSIQPLVENAIRHGIYERGEDGGIVAVRSFRKKDRIEILVEDNGVGFDYDAIMQEIKDGTRDSTGMFNLIYRFEKILHAKVTVESQPNVGTRVTVSIPLEKVSNESDTGR